MLERQRRIVLNKLLRENSPWITQSFTLNQILIALTTEHQPQQLMDMELLFHSCRFEREVTGETITVLQNIWADAKSEQVRMKILAIVDRLVDRAVMRPTDTIFTSTFQWIKLLEETVSPYYSPEVLKLIILIANKCKVIQIEPITPIIMNQLRPRFDDWEDYLEMITSFYR